MSYIWHLLFLFKLLLLFDSIIIRCRTIGEPLSPRSIKTKYGVLRGVLRHYNKQNVAQLPPPLAQIPDKFSIEIFRSVPFAQPPIANLRFLPPVTQSRWRGTKLANRFMPVCIQNTAEIASSDLLSSSFSLNTPVNKDKNNHHDFLSTTISSSYVSSSSTLSLKSSNTSSSVLTSVQSLLNKNLKRTKRTKGTLLPPITASDKLNSSHNFIDQRSARSLNDDVKNGQFDRHFISNLLRIHPNYFRPFTTYIRNQNEDCLYLNLYVPYNENSSGEQYPVVVFVHGESYDWGTGNAYDGSILAGIGKVIVVTLNYRLGVFGFMPSLIEGSVRTNYGILDVVASLHWIQDNIAQFGGSISNITLIGHQRGAALVQLLMKSQLSKGLFQRAVLLSGSALSNWALAEQPEFYTRTLASKVDCGFDTFSTRTSKLPQDNTFNSNTFSSSFSTQSLDLFRSTKFSNQTINNQPQLSSSDERIFQCLRSRSSEQLRTASIRLTSGYYSPFYSLFGPTVDSLLITDDQLPSNAAFNHFNHSHYRSINKNSKFSITNSDHDLLIGFASNAPRFRPALKRMFETLTQQLSKTSSGLNFFYQFLRDFVNYVNNLIQDESLNDQNDFNEISILRSELLTNLQFDLYTNLKSNSHLSSTDFSTNSKHNSTNWMKQTELLNTISSLLFDVLIVAPLFSASNLHHPGSVYTFFLPFEQGEDEFSDQELALLFGSSLAGHYFNVTDGIGRFKTNQTTLKQVQQSQKFISVFLNFFRNGQPSKYNVPDQIPVWPAYNLKSRQFLSIDKQWKIKSPGIGRLSRLLKLVDSLNEEEPTKEFDKLKQKLTDEIRLAEKLPYEQRNKGQLESKILEHLLYYLDLRIKNLGRTEQALKQQLKSRAFNSSQMNKSTESPDPGGGNKQNTIRSSVIEFNELRKTGQNGTISTGNLARIKDNSLINKMDFTNQTADKDRSFKQFFSSFGLNSFSSGGHFDSNGEKNKLFYTNAMIAIISAGFVMLFVNVFVLFLGYKCIIQRRRRILKSKQTNQRKKEELNSKENLSIIIPGQTNQFDSQSNSNTMNFNRQNNMISDSVENVVNESSKCYCGNQFCNCATEVDKLHLINSDSSFFTTDTIITDQPLSHLVSPVCKLINNDNYETDMINQQNKLNHNDQLKQYSMNNLMTNNITNMINSLSNNQLKNDENNLENCDCNLITNTPMLAVLETHPGDSTNLLTELSLQSAIECDPNLYKFFESNYYTPFNNLEYHSNNLDSSILQQQQSVNNLQSNTYQTTMPNTIFEHTNSSTQSIQAHAPQTTIQLQLLTENHLLNTPSQTNNN